MSLLTYLTQAEIRDAAAEMDGKVLTRPALLVTDGSAETYACDVDCGLGQPLRNVPIAPGNRALVYADVGAAVRLRRDTAGRYEVVGFSKTQPGTYTRIEVDIATAALGAPQSVGIRSRPLTYEELATLGGGYGIAPYGAVGIFQGDTLIEVR